MRPMMKRVSERECRGMTNATCMTRPGRKEDGKRKPETGARGPERAGKQGRGPYLDFGRFAPRRSSSDDEAVLHFLEPFVVRRELEFDPGLHANTRGQCCLLDVVQLESIVRVFAVLWFLNPDPIHFLALTNQSIHSQWGGWVHEAVTPASHLVRDAEFGAVRRIGVPVDLIEDDLRRLYRGRCRGEVRSAATAEEGAL